MFRFIKRHKYILSFTLTLALIAGIMGVSVIPFRTQPSHDKSISSGTKYEITIGEQVLAAGLSADYSCTGTADSIVWTAAIAALPAGGGIINDLTGGNYHFAATVNVPANVTIMGIGRSSSFSNNAATPIFTSTGNGTTYENISTDAGGITTGATTGWLEINVAVGTTLYTERSPNSNLVDNTYTGNVTGNLTGDVSATTVGATTLNAPTGRTGYIMVAADGTSLQKSQGDQVLTGTVSTGNDATAINAELVALNAIGTLQTLSLVGDFYCTSEIVAKSNVNVNLTGTITVNSNGLTNGVNCNAVTNSVWTGLTIYRTGVPVGTNSGVFNAAVALVIQNGCDNTLQFINLKAINQCTGNLAEASGITILDSGVYINNFSAYGGGTSDTQNCGIMLCSMKNMPNIGSSANAYIANGSCYGGGGSWSEGIYNAELSNSNFYNLICYGGPGDANDGIMDDNCGVSNWWDCTGYAGTNGYDCYGIHCFGTGSTFYNCKGVVSPDTIHQSRSAGWCLDQNSSPTLLNCIGIFPTINGKFAYISTNNGSFYPLGLSDTHDYIPYYLEVVVNVACPGVTMDVGTTVGGHEIAQNVPLDNQGENPFNNLGHPIIYGGAPLYMTPSSPISNSSVIIYMTSMYTLYNATCLLMNTGGNARIIGGEFIGCGQIYGVVRIKNVTNKNWIMTACNIYCVCTPAYFAGLSADSAMTNVPIYQSIIQGQNTNITSFAVGTPNGTNINP